MLKRLAAIVFIFGCTSIGWVALGSTVQLRTDRQDTTLRDAVGQLWGTVQRQQAPSVFSEIIQQETGGTCRVKPGLEKDDLDGSDITVDLRLEHRRKGLLWYSTYGVTFSGEYRLANRSEEPREFLFSFPLPAQGAVYDNFQLTIGARQVEDIEIEAGTLLHTLTLDPGQSEFVAVSYASQGMEQWWYDFGSEVTQVKGFSLEMNTDFRQIDFPQTSISPTHKEQTEQGWRLAWEYDNLLSGVQIGMVMPHKLNPGPWVSQVIYFAPVSLFLFFFLLFLITVVKEIRIHPMNYFFVGTGFFSYHLLLAYLVDHVSIHLAFWICSAVSVFLVVSYLRLVVGPRFAFVEAGISQFVYLVLFSYTFFFEGYTGLTVSILCVVTLFIVMQFTGRVDWETVFARGGKDGKTAEIEAERPAAGQTAT